MISFETMKEQIPFWDEPHPVKRTVKKYKVFPASNLCVAGRFLCSEI